MLNDVESTSWPCLNNRNTSLMRSSSNSQHFQTINWSVCLRLKFFFSRNILELGCGVGLTGLVALHCSRPKTYTFTDCHETVLKKVRQNLQINNFSSSEQTQERRETFFEERTGISDNFKSLSFSQDVQGCRTCSMFQTGVMTEQCCASVCQLDWKTFTTEEIEKYNPDVILASGKRN